MDNGDLRVPEATVKGHTIIKDGGCVDLTFIRSKTRRGRAMCEKCNCLTSANYDYNLYKDHSIRKLTPVECERLQTFPDNFTKFGIFDSEIKLVSNRQRYKMLGNSFTVDVIAHILGI